MSEITFRNIDIILAHTAVCNTNLDFSILTQECPNWLVRMETIEKVFYHSRYRSVVSPCQIITPPVIYTNRLDSNAFYSIPWPEEFVEGNIYKRFADRKSQMLSGLRLDREVRVYPEGMLCILMNFKLPGDYQAKDLIALINGLLNYEVKFYLTQNNTASVRELFRETCSIIEEHTHSKTKSRIELYESFSVICPTSLYPDLGEAKAYFVSPYNLSLFAAAVRRAELYERIDIEFSKANQKNISLYNTDIVLLNYHNLLVFVRDELNLPADFYIDIAITLKTMSGLIHHYDIRTYEQLCQIETTHGGLRRLRRHTRKLERTRLNALRVIDTFRMRTSVSAMRARVVIERGVETFKIDSLEESLTRKLEQLEFLLSSQYNLNIQRRLTAITIAIGIFTIIVTIVGVVGWNNIVAFFKSIASILF